MIKPTLNPKKISSDELKATNPRTSRKFSLQEINNALQKTKAGKEVGFVGDLSRVPYQ